NTVLMALPWWLKRIVKRNIGEREAAFGLIFFWLAYERLDHDWDMQWPWFSLGNVFATQPSWIQWYEYSGMLGGSLWVLLVNLFIDRAIVAWQRRRPPIAALLRAVTALLLIIVPVLFSNVRYNNYAEQGDPVEVVVVQPNIDPYLEKFGGVEPMAQLDRMLQLAENAISDSTALVIFPETALQENANLDLGRDPPQLQGLWENNREASRSV